MKIIIYSVIKLKYMSIVDTNISLKQPSEYTIFYFDYIHYTLLLEQLKLGEGAYGIFYGF